MKAVLASLGTLGDVLPMVALAHELLRRGHLVTVVVPKTFRSLMEEQRVHFACLDVDTVKSEHSTEFSLSALSREIESSFVVLETAARGCDVVVGSPYQLAGPSIAERFRIPYFLAMPVLAFTDIIRNLRWLTAIDPTFNRRRELLGLSPIDDLATHLLGAGLIFDTSPLTSATGDGNVIATGFWHLDWADTTIAPALLDFCRQEADRPIYLGFGSMTEGNPEKLATLISEAITATGVRAVICGNFTEQGITFPDSCYCTSFVPHQHLLREVRIAVHHGGAGTVASCVAAGLPQGVIPLLADQLYWGREVTALGIGIAPVVRRDLTIESLVAIISTLLSRKSFLAAARNYAPKMDLSAGVQSAAQSLEQIFNGE